MGARLATHGSSTTPAYVNFFMLLFFVFFRPKTRKICPKEDRQEGGWAPPLLMRSDLGQILTFLGRKNTKNNNTALLIYKPGFCICNQRGLT